LKSVRVAYGRFCSLFKLKLYLSRYILSRKNHLSLQLAVGKFITECFMNHESYALQLRVGPSWKIVLGWISNGVSNKMLSD
jgi:hypothetical protein